MTANSSAVTSPIAGDVMLQGYMSPVACPSPSAHNRHMDLKVTTYSVEENVATVTLNRPERLNSWTGRMHAEYRWCIDQAERDPEVGCIIVTGAGRGFCAGADARALEGHAEKGGYDPGTPDEMANPGYGLAPEFDHNFAFHFGLTKPVIAAVNGPAAGVGLVLACYADLRFAAAGAKLTTAHGRLALPAEYGLSWLAAAHRGAGPCQRHAALQPRRALGRSANDGTREPRDARWRN